MSEIFFGSGQGQTHEAKIAETRRLARSSVDVRQPTPEVVNMGPHNTPEEIYFFGLLFRWNEDSQWEVGSSGALNVDYGQIIPVGNDANETTLNVTIQISFHDGRFLGTGDFFDLKAALVLGHVDYTWTEDGNLVWQYNDINGNPISLANISNVISSAKDPNLSDKRGFANRYGFQSKYGFHTRSGFQKRFGF